jgi:hypothetical protein
MAFRSSPWDAVVENHHPTRFRSAFTFWLRLCRAVIFGRKITGYHNGKLQTVMEDLNLPHPVIRSHSHNGVIQQYVRESRRVRREPASNNICTDDGIHKQVENLPRLREKRSAIIDRYLVVQQDILETLLDRGPLGQLSGPTIPAGRQHIAGLKFDHPRQLALRQALVCFAHLATGGIFTAADLHPSVAQAREDHRRV